MTTASKIFTKSFFLMLGSRFGTSMNLGMLSATTASFAFATYDCNETLAGIATGAFVLAAVISRLFAARYLDLLGRRRLFIISSLFFALSTMLYLVPMPYALFIATRAINGVSFGFCSNTANTVSALIVPQEKLGEGLGYLSLGNAFASAAGPFLGIWLFQNVSFQAMFVSCIVCSCLPLLGAFFIETPEITLTDEERARIKASFHLKDCLEFSVLPICAIVGLVDILYFCVSSFVTTFSTEVGTADWASYFFIAYSIIMILFRAVMGKALDVRGEKIVMIPSFIACVLGFFVLAFATNVWGFVLSGMLLGFGRGNIFTAVQTLAVRDVSSDAISKATSSFFMMADTGAGLGPMIMGALVQPLGGYSNLFALQGILLVFIAAAYTIMRRGYK